MQEAHEFVDAFMQDREKLAALPDGTRELVRSDALARLSQQNPIIVAPTLDDDQHKAAFLVGRGWKFSQAEEDLGLDSGDLIKFHQESAEFRHAIDYYRDLTREEIGGLVNQWLTFLLSDDETIPDARLLSLAQKVGVYPDEKKMAEVDAMLKFEQIEAARDIGRVPRARMLGLNVEAVGAALEGEFEVIEDKEDEVTE